MSIELLRAGLEPVLPSRSASRSSNNGPFTTMRGLKHWTNAVGTFFTLEYSYNRPLLQPQTRDLKIILSHTFGVSGMLTFNGAASLLCWDHSCGGKIRTFAPRADLRSV